MIPQGVLHRGENRKEGVGEGREEGRAARQTLMLYFCFSNVADTCEVLFNQHILAWESILMVECLAGVDPNIIVCTKDKSIPHSHI